MPQPIDEEPLDHWARLRSKGHGYSGEFNSEGIEDKRIVELLTAHEWTRSMDAEYGVILKSLKHNSKLNDPPDCFVTFDGQELGVELVQLVEESHKSGVS